MNIRSIFSWQNFVRVGWAIVLFNIILVVIGFFNTPGDGRQYYFLGVLVGGFVIAAVLFAMGVLWLLNKLTERWKPVNAALLLLSWMLAIVFASLYITSIIMSVFRLA